MQWRTITVLLFAASLCVFCMVLPVLPARGAPESAVRAAPSPRPALPTATPKPRHTSKPRNQVGRITGTIIENTTLAPAAGILVDVGGVIVVSDQNGNYERYVPVGTYTVTLVLGDQGCPDQPPQTVHVTANNATIQHLRYTKMREVVTPTPATAAMLKPASAISR